MRIFNRISNNLKQNSSNDAVLVPNSNSENFEVNNWELSDFVVNKLLPIVGVRPFPLNELLLMVGAIHRLHPQVIYEWGTNVGKSARIFFEVAKYFNLNLEIHSIDLLDDVPHVEHPGGERGKFVRKCDNVFLHQGDGLEFSIAHYKKNPTIEHPLFFLDGDHSYKSVYRELEVIIENIPNANILLHDTFFQSSDSGYNIGPYQAYKDILSKYNLPYKVISTETGLPGMTLLYHEK